MEPENIEARSKRLEEEKRRRLKQMADKVNRDNEKRRKEQQAAEEDEDSTENASDSSKSVPPDDKAPREKSHGKKRKDRSSVSSVVGASKRGRESGAAGSGPVRPPRTLTTSQTFPKSDLPPGYSSIQVDNLSTQQVLDMKAMRLKEASKPGGTKSLPGWKMMDTSVVIPIEMIKGGNDDATSCFTPGRWRRFPISVVKRWWENLPLEWKDIVPEFGVEERGMQNRIPREVS